MSKAPWFPLYPADLLADPKVAALDDEAFGAYCRLLCLMWLNGSGPHPQCSLPDDPAVLARMMNRPRKKFEKIWRQLMPENFAIFKRQDGMIISSRLMEEKEKQQVKSDKARQSAEQRWCERNADAMRTVCSSSSSSQSEKELGEASPPPVGQEADGGQGGLFGDGQAETEKPQPVPHQAIIALYNEILPELPPVKVWNGERQGFLRARWREDPQRQDLAWWRAYFQSVRGCPHLMGHNDRNWTPTLEWLLRPNNFAKVLEGYYRRRAGPGAMLSQKGQRTAAAAAEVLDRMDREQEAREQARAS